MLHELSENVWKVLHSKLVDIKYSVQCIENRLVTKAPYCEDEDHHYSTVFGKRGKRKKSWRDWKWIVQLANRFLDQLNNPPENKAHIGVASLCSERGLVGRTVVGPLGRYTLYFHRILHTPWKWSQSLLSLTTTPLMPKLSTFSNDCGIKKSQIL